LPTQGKTGKMAFDQTEDTFFNGRITVFQHREGYRFSIDAVLLADFSNPKPADHIVDLGTGCGIVPLIIGYRHPETRIVGVEIQPELAALAGRNVVVNGLQNRITIIHDDMRSLSCQTASGPVGPVDMVISNPPYRKARSGRINPHSQRAAARHEILITLQEVTDTASRLLGIGGRFAIIFSAERITDLLTNLRSAGLEPKCIQTVHSYIHHPARLVLVSGIKSGRPGATVLKPLVIFQTDGRYSESVQAMFAP
jgi:tRNA1Val (adenine37-N6)-methyltransferase